MIDFIKNNLDDLGDYFLGVDSKVDEWLAEKIEEGSKSKRLEVLSKTVSPEPMIDNTHRVTFAMKNLDEDHYFTISMGGISLEDANAATWQEVAKECGVIEENEDLAAELKERSDFKGSFPSPLELLQRDIDVSGDYIISVLTIRDVYTNKLYQLEGGHESEEYMSHFDWCEFVGEVEIDHNVPVKYGFRKV